MFDALLLASYGGPEGPEEVKPFLDAFLANSRAPASRLATVYDRYMLLGGVSPLPEECRRFLAKLRLKFLNERRRVNLYWGNLYAPPFMDDAFEKMERDGVKSALVLASSAFGSLVCRRYIDNVRNSLANRSPDFERKLTVRHVPPFFETELFQSAVADSIKNAISDAVSRDGDVRNLILFTAHSLPTEWSDLSHYRRQLVYACVASLKKVFPDALKDEYVRATPNAFPTEKLTLSIPATATQLPEELRRKLRCRQFDSALAFQSRSGSPLTPWLEPDVGNFLIDYKEENPTLENVLVVSIGFFFENMETRYDLDVELRDVCDNLGINYRRVECCGASDAMLEVIGELVGKSPNDFPLCQCHDKRCDLSCRLNPTF